MPYHPGNQNGTIETLDELEITDELIEEVQSSAREAFPSLINTFINYSYPPNTYNDEDKQQIIEIAERKAFDEGRLNVFRLFTIDQNNNLVITVENEYANVLAIFNESVNEFHGDDDMAMETHKKEKWGCLSIFM